MKIYLLYSTYHSNRWPAHLGTVIYKFQCFFLTQFYLLTLLFYSHSPSCLERFHVCIRYIRVHTGLRVQGDHHPASVSVCNSPINHTTPTMPITVLSLNANGLNHPAKKHSLWKTALDLKCDILCVQETHFKSTATPAYVNRHFPHVYAAPFTSKRGVLIAVRNSVT